jgi:cyclohexa-1,5-dienecarbonyl-CoA hydratase
VTSTSSGLIATKVRTKLTHDGQVARIVLAAPKANILDRAVMAEILEILATLRHHGNLKAIVVEGEGPHFSFGASIEEHLPGEIAQTLELLHSLLEALTSAPAPTIAAVRGQCLGGGLELALACDLIIAEEGAQFSLPEIKLGVFPPAGAALLPVRIGASRSAELIITGETWPAASAFSAGLVHRIAPAGELNACLDAWLQSDFLPRSTVALHFAAQAARRTLVRALNMDLPELERLYLSELMLHPDPVEGIRSFLEKREPRWAVGMRRAHSCSLSSII